MVFIYGLWWCYDVLRVCCEMFVHAKFPCRGGVCLVKCRLSVVCGLWLVCVLAVQCREEKNAPKQVTWFVLVNVEFVERSDGSILFL